MQAAHFLQDSEIEEKILKIITEILVPVDLGNLAFTSWKEQAPSRSQQERACRVRLQSLR